MGSWPTTTCWQVITLTVIVCILFFFWQGHFGKFERGYLLHNQDCSANPDKTVRVSAASRSQARWWILTLSATETGIPIPDPGRMFPVQAWELYTDAAGVSRETGSLNGWGSCATIDGVTIIALNAWPNSMATVDGTYSHKLTMLEALAVANGLFSIADKIAGRRLRVFTDNKGLYHAMQKVNIPDN